MKKIQSILLASVLGLVTIVSANGSELASDPQPPGGGGGKVQLASDPQPPGGGGGK